MTNRPAFTTASEFARLHGVSREAVRKWKNRELIVMKGDQVDVAASDARVAKFRSVPTRERANSPVGTTPPVATHAPEPDGEVDAEARRRAEAAGIMAAGGADWTLDQAKTHKERFAALLNELEYDQEAGKVVPVADVARIVGEEYARVRTRLLALPAENAPRIQRLKTATEVQDALHELIVEALEELTRDAA